MDPLTALGLASNVVQFLSFTRELVSKGKQISRNADGALVENLELEAVTRNLYELSKGLAFTPVVKKSRLTGQPKVSRSERELQELCEGSQEIARTLLTALQNLKVTDSRNRAWTSFRQALNSVWSAEKIEGLETRLERYQRQINTALLISLRDQIKEVEDRRDAHHQDMSKHLLGFIGETKSWQANLIDSLHRNNWKPDNEHDIQLFADQLQNGVTVERENLHQLRIFQMLRFNEIEERHETIAEAHKKTFDWVFRSGRPVAHHRDDMDDPDESQSAPQWDSFPGWLCGEGDLYWVTGKPGSGKSTLMKYLYNDERLASLSKQWSQQKELVSAGFFFWNSGTDMQMSFVGMLQTLLYQCTRGRPQLIPRLFPTRWQNHELFGGDLRPWTWLELTAALKALVAVEELRFLLFVDGLDEFEKDPAELASFIMELREIAPHNLKLCVASRPWLVFEEAFRDLPWLRLEDLTRPDIQFYVEDKLRGSSRWRDLQGFIPEAAAELTTAVTDKASGVFLWVILVVESLLGGLRDGDDIDDLCTRLKDLPTALEDLFHKILDRLNPEYFVQACELFQIVQTANVPLRLLDLSFAQDGWDAAMKAEVAPLQAKETAFRAETMRRRLLSRCKGLLEAPDAQRMRHTARVQYLHRTVRDFFQSPKIWNFVRSGAPQFDATAVLCSAFLRQVKVTRRCKPYYSIFNEFWYNFSQCVALAQKREQILGEPPINLLDELDRASSAYFDMPSSDPKYDTWLDELITLSFSSQYTADWARILELAKRENTAARNAELQSALAAYTATNEGSQALQDLSAHPAPKVKVHWSNTVVLANNVLKKGEQPVLLHSFFDYMFDIQFNSYVTAKLDRRVASQHKIMGRHLLVHSLESEDFGMVRRLIELGAEPNTKRTRFETTWDKLLELARVCPQDQNARKEELYDLADLFLAHGADPNLSLINEKDGVVLIPLEKSLANMFAVLGQERVAAIVMKVKLAKKKKKGDSGFRKSFRDKFHIRSFSKG